MRDILPEVESWHRDGKSVVLATEVKVWGSALRPLGSKMAVSGRGDIAGSVSGGCVEGAVFEKAQGVFQSGALKLVHFGVSQENIPALKVTLPSPARYIGTQRIHNPIGLDLGGRRAEEMAIPILGEIVATSHSKGLKISG